MDDLTLQPQTLNALQKFLQEWYKDPVSQHNLWITPQNITLTNKEDFTQQIDLISIVTETTDTLPESETEIFTLQETENDLINFTKTEIELAELLTPYFESENVH